MAWLNRALSPGRRGRRISRRSRRQWRGCGDEGGGEDLIPTNPPPQGCPPPRDAGPGPAREADLAPFEAPVAGMRVRGAGEVPDPQHPHPGGVPQGEDREMTERAAGGRMRDLRRQV